MLIPGVFDSRLLIFAARSSTDDSNTYGTISVTINELTNTVYVHFKAKNFLGGVL
jgi:hypothetical protein